MTVTIKDVAKKAGVSSATVSRVLSNQSNVREEVRLRVLKAAEDLRYRPSGIARSMRSQIMPVIGLIITDIQNPFFTSLVRAVEDYALKNDHTVLLCNSDEDSQKEQLYINVLARERVGGIIIVPSQQDCCVSLKKLNVPVVAVDREIKGMSCDTLALDNFFGSNEATNYLIKLGHRRIGFVGAPMNLSVGMDRYKGYEKALCDHDIPINKSLIQIGNFKEDGGYKAVQRLFEEEPIPTAVFVVNNLMTIGALKAIHEKKLRIPDDISIIGFDDMPWLSLISPPLTAVRQPIYEIGAEASQLLFSRINGEKDKSYKKLILKPELIVRGSTKKFE